MIEKKYCADYESNVSFLDVEIDGNRIKYKETGQSFYKIYVWQQELVNKMLKEYDEVILEIEYIELGYTKEIKFTNSIDIYKERAVSSQCYDCLKRKECKVYQTALNTDFVMSVENDEQLYNLYLLVGAKKAAMEAAEASIRKMLDKKIEASGNSLHLQKLNLNLFTEQTYTDSFPIDVAIKEKLLTPKNCKILIGQFRKDVKGTEHEKLLKRVPHQKKLNIGNIPELL